MTEMSPRPRSTVIDTENQVHRYRGIVKVKSIVWNRIFTTWIHILDYIKETLTCTACTLHFMRFLALNCGCSRWLSTLHVFLSTFKDINIFTCSTRFFRRINWVEVEMFRNALVKMFSLMFSLIINGSCILSQFSKIWYSAPGSQSIKLDAFL